MTYAQAIEFLNDLSFFGAKLGLEQTFKLAELVGNPQQRLRFIHVAGTNGKGSTCAMLESIYRAAGLRVGLFTSPHLVSFRERIQINRQLISEADVVRLVESARDRMNQFSAESHPTFFEIITIMALRCFEEQGCDLVIWETGLGGRLDATNIVTPLASVITNVQFDHEKWLGNTLDKIASEKAGIIKREIPVVTAAESKEAISVIRETAQYNAAPLTVVTPADTQRPPLNSIRLPLLGEHQKLNAAVAIATVRVINGVIPVSDGAIRVGLESVYWPGRLQIIRRDGRSTILLDGAHNPAGVEALRAALVQYFPETRPTLIFAAMQDKDWPQMCRTLVPLLRRVILAPVESERSAAPTDIEKVFRVMDSSLDVLVCSSLNDALQRAASDPFVVITGSLHFIGEAAAALRLMPDLGGGERALNEWTAGHRR